MTRVSRPIGRLAALAIASVLVAGAVQAGSVREEYDKAERGGYLDDYKDLVRENGGWRLRQEVERVEREKTEEANRPNLDLHRDADGNQYLRRCGYGGANCQDHKVN